MRASRNELFSLLSEACEIEHSLACAYLYAAFSLKQNPDQLRDWRDQQITRRWAGQIYFVASQEMLHLAQAWNLLAAIGGSPYFMHPSFPQAKSYWPLPAALALQRFCLESVERFLQWEAPARPSARVAFERWEHEPADQERSYRSVGQLYDQIAESIQALPEAELFLGDPNLQIGPDLADFPDLVRVTNQASALEAIRCIQHQGEGSPTDREDSHFGIFHEMREQLRELLAAKPGFDPAHPALANPTTRSRVGASAVSNATTRHAMELFNDTYVLTMRLLGWVFGPSAPHSAVTRSFAKAGIGAMPLILRPLGEALARMPSGDDVHTAGAPFALQRHVSLPSESGIALRLVREQIAELKLQAGELLLRPDLTEDLAWLPRQFSWLEQILTNHPEGTAQAHDGL